MIKNYFLLGSLLCSMGAFSQSTVWKHTGWEAQHFDNGHIWNRLSSRIRKVMTPFLSFVLGKVTVVLLFMLKSVVKKLPQLGYLTDIFLIGVR